MQQANIISEYTMSIMYRRGGATTCILLLRHPSQLQH